MCIKPVFSNSNANFKVYFQFSDMSHLFFHNFFYDIDF